VTADAHRTVCGALCEVVMEGRMMFIGMGECVSVLLMCY
jgi:hypothetical protein